jgi:hypothetical protein
MQAVHALLFKPGGYWSRHCRHTLHEDHNSMQLKVPITLHIRHVYPAVIFRDSSHGIGTTAESAPGRASSRASRLALRSTGT